MTVFDAAFAAEASPGAGVGSEESSPPPPPPQDTAPSTKTAHSNDLNAIRELLFIFNISIATVYA
jgi:hypothetical protein